MNIQKLSPGYERLAEEIIDRVGEPVDMSSEEMTEDEAILVARYLFGMSHWKAKYMIAIAKGKIKGDIITEKPKE